ncbi:hypothetical protein I6A84_02505 [Frankia sp. CNm7]|uniref:Uncharacterized protein n=1 Tax=Frankia nepalensis TaxID=1836974 RepID=A0A937USN1_9ACTN|nr:hypothetical protein [Frankia nepalensis]MBL7502020.1 hypothetical protein [Frankia nepalensis]MBL7510304.1 hypothetical protein [Frankia nepalensis]MBL7517026.1 hypothetical protein [Frankia nepalensis]MBL7630435.1 hypothetical protein [Frankia nepalensis]
MRLLPAAEVAAAGGGEDWAAVAGALNARMALCRMGQHRLAEASGISVATVRLLQCGTGRRRTRDATLAALSRALGWPDGHLVHVLLGQQPVENDGARLRAVGARIRPPHQPRRSEARRPVSGDAKDAQRASDRVGNLPALAAVTEDLAVVADLLADVLGHLTRIAATGPQTARQ